MFVVLDVVYNLCSVDRQTYCQWYLCCTKFLYRSDWLNLADECA